ncbi:hypothetical protein ACK3TF_004878 [Chlorella vulgaris]
MSLRDGKGRLVATSRTRAGLGPPALTETRTRPNPTPNAATSLAEEETRTYARKNRKIATHGGDRLAAAALPLQRLRLPADHKQVKVARVWEGDGFSQAERQDFIKLAQQLRHPFNHDSNPLDMLHSDGKELEGLQLLNKLYDWLHSHGWLDQWRVLNVELVASCTGGTPHASVAGQTDADHQDRHTGSLAYKRPPPAPYLPGGVRVLFDVGNEEGQARNMVFKLLTMQGRTPVAAECQLMVSAGRVVMDALAAGSGGWWGGGGYLVHGRYGTGYTISPVIDWDGVEAMHTASLQTERTNALLQP